jgi:WD40 repeat protein
MAKEKPEEQLQRASEALLNPLPPGLKLLHTLTGHRAIVNSVAFDPQGGTLASGSHDNTVMLWDSQSGKLLCTLTVVWRIFAVRTLTSCWFCPTSRHNQPPDDKAAYADRETGMPMKRAGRATSCLGARTA